jgi:VWFA-related protein
VYVGVFVLGAISTLADQPPNREFQAGVALVTVDVVVTDRHGHTVPGLDRSQFRLTEDGRPREILQFQAVQVPPPTGSLPTAPASRPRVSSNAREAQPARTFAIVFDDLHLSPAQADPARKVVAAFLREALSSNDRVALITTGGDVWWTTVVGRGRDDLFALTRRLQGHRPPDTTSGHISDWEALRIHERDRSVLALVTRRLTDMGAVADLNVSRGYTGIMKEMGVTDEGHPMVRSRAEEVYAASVNRRRVTLGLLARVTDALAGAEGRKSVILVSEGFVSEPQRSEYRDVIASARRTNVAIYFLNARGGAELATAGASDSPRLLSEGQKTVGERNVYIDAERNEAEGAVSVALDTGGFAVGATADLARAIRQIADESRVYYLLAYDPLAPLDGKYHKIGVEVLRDGLAVYARKGYFADTPRGKGRDPEPANDKLTPAIRAALDAPADDSGLPLRLAAYVRNTDGDKTDVMLVGEIDVGALPGARPGAPDVDIEYYMASVSRESGERAGISDKAHLSLSAGHAPLVTRNFRLSGGTWQARLVVRDANSGRMGSVTHDFEVPAHQGFRMTTPILTDMVEPGPRPVPVAHLAFAAGAPVVAQFEVSGQRSGPDGRSRVLSGFTLTGPGGRTLAHMDPTPIRPGTDGRLARMLKLPVPPEPGQYDLTLTAHDDIAGGDLVEHETFWID